jgi:hypothetical protein
MVVRIALAATLTSCSSEQIYNAVQNNQKLECQKYPDVRYEECMDRLNTSYDDYETDRNEGGKSSDG